MILEEMADDNNYQCTRKSLVLPAFNREQYCLNRKKVREKENDPDDSFDGILLSRLVEEVKAGNLAPGKASGLFNKV